MPVMALREFECTLCSQSFTLLAGDLMVPAPNLCDACLEEIWALEGKALESHVAGCLPDADERLVAGVIRHLGWHRSTWSSAGEAIAQREQDRQMWG